MNTYGLDDIASQAELQIEREYRAEQALRAARDLGLAQEYLDTLAFECGLPKLKEKGNG